MSPDRNRLHMAVQKSGRLSDQSRQLLKDAGLRLAQGGKANLTARAENFPLDLMLVRDDDIPTFVADGVCELGIVGHDRKTLALRRRKLALEPGYVGLEAGRARGQRSQYQGYRRQFQRTPHDVHRIRHFEVSARGA